jgi:hypothetical protein
VLLQVAASNDLLAHWMYASVATISWTFRVLVPLVPPLLGLFTYRLMKALQASGRERFAELPLRDVLRPAEVGAGAVVDGQGGRDGEGAELHLDQESDGWWRWRYVDQDHDVDLCSNRTFATAEAARESATRAYPQTPIRG